MGNRKISHSEQDNLPRFYFPYVLADRGEPRILRGGTQTTQRTTTKRNPSPAQQRSHERNNLSLNSAPQPGAKRRRTMTSTNNNNNTSNNRSSSSSSSSGSSASSSPASNGNVISRMTVPIVGFRSSNVNGSAIAQPGFRRVVLGKAQGGGQKHTGGQK